MNVVGLDFGTTNVRVAFWDSDRDAWGDDPDGAGPQPQMLGEGGTSTMPAVIALSRQPGGEVSYLVGEEADQAEASDTTLVIRNIKRYAMSTDAYVNWHLDVRSAHEDTPGWPPTWWNAENHCVQAWGQEFAIWDLIERILDEALLRSGMEGDYEWRAGCPVHAGFEYRSRLSQALRNLTGKGETTWVVEEPVLFMTLAHRLGRIGGSDLDGAYLVYDFGGGSFDCAVVAMGGDENQMLIYGADGHPLMGGSDIDERLTERVGGQVGSAAVRIAKESLGPTTQSVPLGNGVHLSSSDFDGIMNEGGFVNKSLMTMRDAYIASKAMWKRGEGLDDPPIGEIINRNRQTGRVRFVWQLNWGELAEDIDAILLFGGPTRAAHIRDRLADRFGSDKVKSVAEVFPTLSDSISDLDLVGVSMGACYTYDERHSPLYLSRLPARVVLEDLESGASVEYEPFQYFTKGFKPFEGFISDPLPIERPIMQSAMYPEGYKLTMMNPDGVVHGQAYVDRQINGPYRYVGSFDLRSGDRFINSTLRLVIDRYGRIGVEHKSDTEPPKRFMVFGDTPWQTESQKAHLQRFFEQEQRYAEEERAKGRRSAGLWE